MPDRRASTGAACGLACAWDSPHGVSPWTAMPLASTWGKASSSVTTLCRSAACEDSRRTALRPAVSSGGGVESQDKAANAPPAATAAARRPSSLARCQGVGGCWVVVMSYLCDARIRKPSPDRKSDRRFSPANRNANYRKSWSLLKFRHGPAARLMRNWSADGHYQSQKRGRLAYQVCKTLMTWRNDIIGPRKAWWSRWVAQYEIDTCCRPPVASVKLTSPSC
jgi:hypothetical protein